MPNVHTSAAKHVKPKIIHSLANSEDSDEQYDPLILETVQTLKRKLANLTKELNEFKQDRPQAQ